MSEDINTINNVDQLKDIILKVLEEKKAENIIVMPMSSAVSIAKYLIFASGRSVKNIGAIAEHVALELKHRAKWPANIEGLNNSSWVLIDAGDIIVHIFHPEAREHYKLEEFWREKI